MAFGQDVLKSFFGSDSLRDFQHASKSFRSNGYEFIPRNKFLFHVYFNINLTVPALSQVFKKDMSNLGLLVKTVNLPTYGITVDTLNQYNRKRIIQTKINYNPVEISFHDDQSDLIRNMWYNYFSYYYKDPTQKYDGIPTTDGSIGASPFSVNGSSYSITDTYNAIRTTNDWGYIGETYRDSTTGTLSELSDKPPFFRDIRIFGMSQHNFAAYVLINPLISRWNHDTYDYSQGSGIMEHKMEINFETVKYYSGQLSSSRPDTNVIGFADPAHYDQKKSSLARHGSTRSILGTGGLIDAGVGIINDLSKGSVSGVIGAVQKAGTVWQTWKGANIKAVVKQEAINGIKDIVRGGVLNPTPAANQNNTSIFFPTPPRTLTAEQINALNNITIR